MYISRRILIAALTAASLALAACGGGSDNTAKTVIPMVPPVAVTPAVPAGSVKISGQVMYDSVPNTSGPLDYSAVVSKPVRGAIFQIIGASTQTVLASGITDVNGNYTATVPQGVMAFVQVRAALKQSGTGATWDVSVRDNTQGNGLYALETRAFSTTSLAPILKNLNATSGWGITSYNGPRLAGPFSILDLIYTTQAKILSVSPNAVFPALNVFWSVNNVPSDGDVTLGQIGTSYFSSYQSAIFILGKDGVDTDEYDWPVLAHEWGHYFQTSFSRDDSPGGSHAAGDLLDRRVAFSEGWGNGWSGIALNRTNYTDSFGPAQSQTGNNIDLTVGASATPGWFREVSVEYLFWKLNSISGFQPIFDAMTGPLKTSTALTSIHSFNAALKTVSSSASASFAPLLTSENVDSTADAWGSTESNSGGSTAALPMYRDLIVGAAPTNVCVSNVFGSAQGDNKLGNYTYLHFVIPSAGNYSVNIANGSNPNSDPYFSIYNGDNPTTDVTFLRPAGGSKSTVVKVITTKTAKVSASGTVNLPTGDYVLSVTDYANSSASTCFDISIH